MISPGADSASVRSAMRTWSRPIHGIAGGGHTNVSAGDRVDVRGPSPARLDCDSTNLGTASKIHQLEAPVTTFRRLVGLVERNMLKWLANAQILARSITLCHLARDSRYVYLDPSS